MKIDWSRNDYSSIPYYLYHDESIYQEEMEKIFRGPCWSFVGFEAEVPNIGDFRTSWIGDTPIVVSRSDDGHVHALLVHGL